MMDVKVVKEKFFIVNNLSNIFAKIAIKIT